MANPTRELHWVENSLSSCLRIAEKRLTPCPGLPSQDSRSTESHTANAPALLDVAAGDTQKAWSQSQRERKPPRRATAQADSAFDRLLTADDVAERLNVSKDWVWDHSSRKTPRLPVIRMGDGALRYRASAIEAFISERERLSAQRYGSR